MSSLNKKIGFIGCGNMAQAMLNAIAGSGCISPNNIFVSTKHEYTLQAVNEKYGVNIEKTNIKVAEKSDIIFLAVKPNLYKSIIEEIKNIDHKDKIYISIAPGKTIDFLHTCFNSQEVKILRAMPNTPSFVQEGITAICPNKNITEKELELLTNLINSFGAVEIIEENLFAAFTSVAGSSPAYVFILLEAMADAAVLQGMSREQAYRAASKAVLGSASMLIKTQKHPAELKDMVCSPQGTTIEAVAHLEKSGFRSSIIEAMRICGKKAKNS